MNRRLVFTSQMLGVSMGLTAFLPFGGFVLLPLILIVCGRKYVWEYLGLQLVIQLRWISFMPAIVESFTSGPMEDVHKAIVTIQQTGGNSVASQEAVNKVSVLVTALGMTDIAVLGLIVAAFVVGYYKIRKIVKDRCFIYPEDKKIIR